MSADGAPSAPVQQATRIVLRPIANPLPLGFLALAAGTLLMSGVQLGWLPVTDGRSVALMVIAFVVPLQLLAAIFGVLARDVVAGTAMGLLAGTWLSIALVTLDGAPGATSDALGLLLLIAAAALVIPATAAARTKLVPAVVIGTSAARFALTGLFQLTAGAGWKEIAGLTGVALCAIAGYAAAAMLIEDARGAAALPVGRRADGAAALHAGLAGQLHGVEHEAGVRGQL